MIVARIRQSEFAEKHKLLPGEVKELREKYLVGGEDFIREGRTIYWTEEAAEKIVEIIYNPPKRAIYETGEQSEHVSDEISSEQIKIPESFTVRVTRPCLNKRMAYADLNGTKIAVVIGRNRDKFLKKTITVIKDDNSENYIYLATNMNPQ